LIGPPGERAFARWKMLSVSVLSEPFRPLLRSEMTDIALLIRAFQLSQMLSVAAELGIADRIDDQAVSVEDLARASAAHPGMLFRMLRALSAFGIFAVDDEGRVGHSQASRLLRRDVNPTLHDAARYWTMHSNWAAWEKLERTIRTGEPAFEGVFGMANFEYLKQHPEEADLFNRFMQRSPDDRHNAVAEGYDFSGTRTVVDVGGGNGALLATLLQKYPGLSGVLFDQENALTDSLTVLGPVAGRCQIVAGDFFSGVPAGADAFVLSQILHDWDDDHCLHILRNCHAAMPGEARLLVVERVLESGGNPMNYLSDMDMMVLFPGARERTLKEYGELFTGAGFGAPTLTRTRSPFCIIEVRHNS
jgi:hypothetical protein